MKKVTFLTSLFALTLNVVFAQVPNLSFETWTAGSGYEDPTNWATSNGLYPSTVSKSSTFHDGAYAVKLESKPHPLAPAYIIPGFATNGKINGTTIVAGSGSPYTTRSEKLTGFYQYTPGTGDMAVVGVYLMKWNTSTNKRDSIGWGTFTTGTSASSYTAFEVLITYNNNYPSYPDTALITLSAAKNVNSAVAGSSLLVDHLAFTGNVVITGINENNVSASNAVFPNPAINELTITTDEKANSIALYDIAGRMMDEVVVENKTANVNTSSYAKGIYYYTVLGKNNTMMSKGKFAIVK